MVKMSPRKLGRLGGLKTLKRHGVSHFVTISKKGARKGGLATLKRHGREFFRRIGARGGRG